MLQSSHAPCSCVPGLWCFQCLKARYRLHYSVQSCILGLSAIRQADFKSLNQHRSTFARLHNPLGSSLPQFLHMTYILQSACSFMIASGKVTHFCDPSTLKLLMHHCFTRTAAVQNDQCDLSHVKKIIATTEKFINVWLITHRVWRQHEIKGIFWQYRFLLSLGT